MNRVEKSPAGYRVYCLLALLGLVVAVLACSDSDDTLLGSRFVDDLVSSRPGIVFEDSIPITAGDTSYTFYRPIDQQLWFEVGIQDDYERIAIVKSDFSEAEGDTLKTVTSATLRLTALEFYVETINVLFYQLGTEYNEGDTLTTVDTTTAIPDPVNNDALVRFLSRGDLAYNLPADLVQEWIRGTTPHNGIAIVYAEDSSNELYGITSRNSEVNSPSILVNFSDGTSSNYEVTDDCTFVRPLSDTSNLVLSDGFVRRVSFPIDLSQVDDSAAVHSARVVFNLVPGSVFGTNLAVELYVPNSADPASEKFLTGVNIISMQIDEDAGVLELPLTNVLLLVLSGEIENNGFVMRFEDENSEARQTEFYTGSHPDLHPKVYITYSTPAEFEE